MPGFLFCAGTGALPERGRDRLSPTPPSEPYVRFSRIRLSSWWFLHRDCLAVRQAACMRTAGRSRSRRLLASYDAVTSADSMRSIHISASAPNPVAPGAQRFCTLLSLFGTHRCFSASNGVCASTFLPRPSLGAVLLSSPPVVRAPDHLGTMRALTPAPLRRRSRSLRSVRIAFPASRPQPRYAARWSLPITSRHRPDLAVQASP